MSKNSYSCVIIATDREQIVRARCGVNQESRVKRLARRGHTNITAYALPNFMSKQDAFKYVRNLDNIPAEHKALLDKKIKKRIIADVTYKDILAAVNLATA